MKRKDIKEFETLRSIMSRIYTYGFDTRDDFAREILGRSYDYIKKLLCDLYFTDLDQDSPFMEDRENRGKYKCCKFRRNYFDGSGQALSAVYGVSAIHHRQLRDILVCLSQAQGKRYVKELVDLAEQFPVEGDSEDSGSRLRIDRRVRSLEEQGYLERAADTKRFRLPQPFASLDEEELTELYYLILFFSETGYLRVPALYLKKALLRHLAYRGIKEPPAAFLFRDATCANILDEDVAIELLEHCRSRTTVTVISKRSKKQLHLKPVYLRFDRQYGRWYLFALQETRDYGDAPVIMRISNIRLAPRGESVPFDYAAADQKLRRSFQRRYLSSSRTAEPVQIEAKLCFTRDYLRQQFQRELLVGRIEEREDGPYYCAELDDSSEVKPLLRSYYAHLKIRPAALDQAIREEYERMYAQL